MGPVHDATATVSLVSSTASDSDTLFIPSTEISLKPNKN